MNIVLAHGILGFREMLGIKYFKGVADFLQQRRLRVLVTEVDRDDSIPFRGSQLRDQIKTAFDNGIFDRWQKTHIIAHSMGGLDARSFLSPNNPNDITQHIASLTTIGTPHQGSPVADALFSAVDGKAAFSLGSLAEDTLRDIILRLHISLNGLHDLTTWHMADFNQANPDNNNVRYFSIAGVGRTSPFPLLPFPPTCLLLLPIYLALKLEHGDSDGLVPVASASRWANTELWPADHADEVGHNLDLVSFSAPDGFNHLQAYEKIIEQLRLL